MFVAPGLGERVRAVHPPAPSAPAPSGPPRISAPPPREPADAIVVEDLVKVYPDGTRAVQGISFRVRRGEIFGILGPNGAGKSTTIGVLGTLVRPTSGRAFVNGVDVTRHRKAVRSMIGFAMQEAGVDELASGREFLVLQGRLYGLSKATIEKRAAELFKLFELEEAADKRIKSYSGGMKRRIDLASALIHFPKILFLDEPTEGLDPRSRIAMWGALRRLRDKLGTTILLSTHFMDEADRLCDRIAIIDQGRIVAQDTPARLKASVGGQSVVLEYGPAGRAQMETAERLLQQNGSAMRTQRTATELHVYVRDAAEASPRILRALDAGRVPPTSLRIHQPTFDDVYLRYTGRKMEEAEAAAAPGAKR